MNTKSPNTKHGVIYQTGHDGDFIRYTDVLMIEGNGFVDAPIPETLYTIEQLADIALQHHITHLWLMDDYGYPRANSHDEYSIKEYERHKKTAIVSVWKRGSGHVDIFFTPHMAWYPIVKNAHPKTFLIACRYYTLATGIQVTGSPGSMGWGYLKTLHPDWIEDVPDVNLKDIHFSKASGKDIIWQRPPCGDELRKKYLHKFDGNSEYPYATTSVDVGTGTPVHLEGKEAWAASLHGKGHPQEVGVWLCSVSGNPLQADMPTVWTEKDLSRPLWMSGPMVRLHRAMGYAIDISEGWVFPARHDVMSLWAKNLWKFRQSLLTDRTLYKNVEGATLAASMVKFTANATVGFTAFRGFEDEDEEKRRPDIRLQAVTRSTEIIWHNINKVRELTGLIPVMVYMDALYYLSDDPQGFPMREHFQKREKEFGGFKYCGHIELDTVLWALLTGDRPGPAAKLGILNNKGWVK